MKMTHPPLRPRGRKQKARGRSRLLFLLLLTLCGGVLLAAGALSSAGRRAAAAPPSPQEAEISPEALAQIESLIAEKESRTGAEMKMDSQLIYELKMSRGEWVSDRVREVETDVEYNDDGKVVVDIKAEVSSGLLSQLRAGGAEILDTVAESNSIRASVPLDNVESIAALPGVKFIQPKQEAATSAAASAPVVVSDASVPTVSPAPAMPSFPVRAASVRAALGAALRRQDAVGNVAGSPVSMTGVGSRNSEGVLTHGVVSARGTFNTDGTGIKIGVLSDGVRSLAASQAAGDLGPVTVLPGQDGSAPGHCNPTGTCDEGTAMLEIVHDMAPGAQLYFATAFGGINNFANNILALRAAGCDIIVDDVFYFVETPFQDGQAPGVLSTTNGGIVVEAVNTVTASGAMYFSSAGNSGNLTDGTAGVWEGDFKDGGPTAAPLATGNRLHNFAAVGTQNFNQLTVVNTAAPISLYWSDPLGASSNDYDMFRLNPAGTAVVGSSTNIQSGTQDPYEQVNQATTSPRIVVVKKASAQPRFLHLNGNRGRFNIVTNGTTHGHSHAAEAFSTAATPAVGPFPNLFSSLNLTETFTSDGPRRIFYTANGTPYTPGNFSATGGIVRQKPDITAADGVSVTGVGGFGSPFFGTSAAAPHAAAIAALIKAAGPSLTPAQIRAALISTAIDIETPGTDRDTGAGIVMPYAAMQALGLPGTAFLEFGAITASENPGDGNGIIDAGDGASLVVQLKNTGVANATNITATLTSSTPGVTVTLPNTSPYADLAAGGGTGTNLQPLLFTVAGNVSCPATLQFTLTVNYTGGNGGSQVLNFTVPVGPPPVNISSVLDTTAPASGSGFTATTGTQIGRINRLNAPSACGAAKAFPGMAATTGARQYDAYTFQTCPSSGPSCITVTFSGANAINMFSLAYNGTFNPADPSQNYLADPAASAASRTYSFNLPAGAQTFTIVVHEVNPGGAVGSAYTLNVSGGCIGSCPLPNQVPVAKAKNVTVAADANCEAFASVDDGSFDPDGDPITITQSPAGPYPLGTTPVLLTVTDPRGATSQAWGSVTVVDATAPTVSAATATPDSMWPPNHQMFDVTVNYTASDNCGPVTSVLTVSSNEPINGTGDGDTAPDWEIVDDHHVRLRSERAGKGSGRVYTITVTTTDGAGNQTVRTTTVTIPKSQK